MKKVIVIALCLAATLFSCIKKDSHTNDPSTAKEATFTKGKGVYEEYYAPNLDEDPLLPNGREEATAPARKVTILVRDINGVPAPESVKIRVFRIDNKMYTTPKKYSTNYKELGIKGVKDRRYVVYAEDVDNNIGVNYKFVGSIQSDTTINLTIKNTVDALTPNIKRVRFNAKDNQGNKLNFVKNTSGDKIQMILTDQADATFIIPLVTYNSTIGLDKNSTFGLAISGARFYNDFTSTFNFTGVADDSTLQKDVIIIPKSAYPVLTLKTFDNFNTNISTTSGALFVSNTETGLAYTTTSLNFSQGLPWGRYKVDMPYDARFFTNSVLFNLNVDTTVTYKVIKN